MLGIGVSHKPLVLNLRGHSYDKPYSYMKEYLPKYKSALYRAPKAKEEVPVVIAALHPKMLQLAATRNSRHSHLLRPARTYRANPRRDWPQALDLRRSGGDSRNRRHQSS